MSVRNETDGINSEVETPSPEDINSKKLLFGKGLGAGFEIASKYRAFEERGYRGFHSTILWKELLLMEQAGICDPLQHTDHASRDALHGSVVPTISPSDAEERFIGGLQSADLKNQERLRRLLTRSSVWRRKAKGLNRTKRFLPILHDLPVGDLEGEKYEDQLEEDGYHPVNNQVDFPKDEIISCNDDMVLDMKFSNPLDKRKTSETTIYLPGSKAVSGGYSAQPAFRKLQKVLDIPGEMCEMSYCLLRYLETEACIVAWGGLEPLVPWHDFDSKFHRTSVDKLSSLACVLESIEGTFTKGEVLDQLTRELTPNQSTNQEDMEEAKYISTCFKPPNVLVGFEKQWLSVSAEILIEWENAQLSPYSLVASEIQYMSVRIWLEHTKNGYERFRGKLISITDEHIDVSVDTVEINDTKRNESACVTSFGSTTKDDLENLNECLHVVDQWKTVLQKLRSDTFYSQLRKKLNKASASPIVLFVVAPMNSCYWNIFLMQAFAEISEKLHKENISVGFQLIPAELLLGYRRSRKVTRMLATSVFIKFNRLGQLSPLVVLDRGSSETADKTNEDSSVTQVQELDCETSKYHPKKKNLLVKRVHVSCTYSEDRSWISVAWTDSFGSMLSCRAYQAEDIDIIAERVIEKCFDLYMPETGEVVLVVFSILEKGEIGSLEKKLWIKSLVDMKNRRSELEIFLCVLSLRTVSLPREVVCGEMSLNLKIPKQVASSLEEISFISSDVLHDFWSSQQSCEDSNPKFPDLLSLLTISLIYHTCPQLNSEFNLDVVCSDLKCLAWLSRGSFGHKPLSCVPLHLSASSRLAHWLQGASYKQVDLERKR